ncbi:hypothetical protein SynMVIR181_02537 [Synechococcus sp. MVIR-18-1]|nr:hypothetical protein SynMVIR181_02537 [Synechococcus sp. MVIR-18-1]
MTNRAVRQQQRMICKTFMPAAKGREYLRIVTLVAPLL